MSDHGNQFVNVTVSLADSWECGHVVRAWMRQEGFTVPGPEGDTHDWASPKLTDEAERWTLPVEFFPGKWDTYACFNGMETPRCPNCTSGFGNVDFLQAWYDSHQTPTLRCAQCAYEGPVLDWDVTYSCILGNFAVMTPVLDDPVGFCEKLNATGTGRWIYVYYHL